MKSRKLKPNYAPDGICQGAPRIVRKDGKVKFRNKEFSHPILKDWIGVEVWVSTDEYWGVPEVDVRAIYRHGQKTLAF